jgi:hypothetical protein
MSSFSLAWSLLELPMMTSLTPSFLPHPGSPGPWIHKLVILEDDASHGDVFGFPGALRQQPACGGRSGGGRRLCGFAVLPGRLARVWRRGAGAQHHSAIKNAKNG